LKEKFPLVWKVELRNRRKTVGSQDYHSDNLGI
jgi:hypothetical protein